MKYDELIPKAWNLKTLGDIVAQMSAGTSVNGFDTPASGEQAGVLKLSAVSQGRFFPQENKAVKPEELGRVGPTVRQGTLLISRSNTSELVGECTCIRQDYPRLHIPDLLWVIETESDCDPVWMQYLFAARPVRRGIRAIATGTSGSMQKISMGAFRKVWVPVPPLPEQQKIAAILSTWDRAIESTEKLIAAKQRRKQALMQQLLTGKVRFKEFEGKPWRKMKLGKLLTVRNEQIENDGTHPLYSLTIENGVTPKTDRYDREALVRDKAAKKYKVVKPGDIVFNPSNLRWGAIGIHHGVVPVLVSPIYEVLFVTKEDAINNGFLFQQLSSARQIALFSGMAEGTLIERTAVKLPTFLACEVLMPPTKDEQLAVACVLVAADQEQNVLSQRKASLTKQKKGLMQQLLTGKVRVIVDAEMVKE